MARPVSHSNRKWSFGKVLFSLILLGLVLAPLPIGLSALSRIDHRWTDILAQFTAPAFLATLALVVGLLVIRQWRWACATLVVAAVMLAAVWPQWAPGGPKPQADAPVVRVYSANVHFLNADVAAMKASVDAANPDIVVLIELGAEPMRRLDEMLPGHPHRTEASMPTTRGFARTVIASRWPLRSVRSRSDNLADAIAVVDTPLGPVNVVGVHLTRPWPFQFQWGQIGQVMSLTEVVEPMHGPVIVAGDFNSVSSARIGRQVQTDIGLHPAPGFPGTWPSDLPPFAGVTIDQVYASGDLAFVSRRVGQKNGSDHWPVITEITRSRP